MYGICAKCLEMGVLTRHHILPRQWYKKQKNAPLVFLCRECHNELHKILPKKRLKKSAYVEITKRFLLGDVLIRA